MHASDTVHLIYRFVFFHIHHIMQIPKDIEEAMNVQAGMELNQCHVYMALSFWAHHANYPGISNWFMKQSDEERKV